jgi:hypothetical protein
VIAVLLAGIPKTVRPKIANPGRRHQVELWSQRLWILGEDIKWRHGVIDYKSWKKTSSGDVQSKIVNPERRHQVEMWSLLHLKPEACRQKNPLKKK